MFAIDQDNRIYYGDPKGDDDKQFADLAGLTIIAILHEWSKQTVTDIWNRLVKDLNLAGIERPLKPQKCFRNRPYGLAKLWDAIQRLVPSDATSEAPAQEEGATDASLQDGWHPPEPGPIPEKARERVGALRNRMAGRKAGRAVKEAERPADAILEGGLEEEKPAKKAKKKRAAKAWKPAVAKGNTKRDEVIRLISRQNGASLDELVEKMGWERHTLRGLLSTLASKQGLKIESTKDETKGRVYRLVA